MQAIAILGFSLGAKAKKTACDFPCGFCAVPVLPQTIMSFNLLAEAVPPGSIAPCIPSITLVYAS